MKKICLFGLMLFSVTLVCHSQNRVQTESWMQKFFLDFNVLYDYEKVSVEDDFYIQSSNILFEIALGYDFGRIVPRVFFDIGLPLDGTVGFSDGGMNLNEVMDTENLKFGFEVGLKPIKTQRFDLIIPLGVLFAWTTYTQKNPNYVDDVPYDRIWEYSYINLFSGINAVYQLNQHFKIGFFSRVGLPVKKGQDYKEVLRGGYVWTSNDSETLSTKHDITVLDFSLGIGILTNL
jgi:hypothetical protein